MLHYLPCWLENQEKEDLGLHSEERRVCVFVCMMSQWKNVFRTAQMLKGTTSQFLRAICDNFSEIVENIEKH